MQISKCWLDRVDLLLSCPHWICCLLNEIPLHINVPYIFHYSLIRCSVLYICLILWWLCWCSTVDVLLLRCAMQRHPHQQHYFNSTKAEWFKHSRPCAAVCWFHAACQHTLLMLMLIYIFGARCYCPERLLILCCVSVGCIWYIYSTNSPFADFKLKMCFNSAGFVL